MRSFGKTIKKLKDMKTAQSKVKVQSIDKYYNFWCEKGVPELDRADTKGFTWGYIPSQVTPSIHLFLV